MDYCDIEWLDLEMNRVHLVIFELAPKNCISDPFVDLENIVVQETKVEEFYENLQDLLEVTPPKDVLFIIGDWNAKVGSQETPGVTGKFGLGIWNEAGQRQSFAKRMHWS